MFCDEALDAVEAIAAGDLMPDGRVAAHLAIVPELRRGARRARGSSRRSLRSAAGAGGAARSSPRGRWRASGARAGAAISSSTSASTSRSARSCSRVLGGVWMLLHRSGLAAVSSDAVDVLRQRLRRARAARRAVAAALCRRRRAAGQRARHLVVGGAGCRAVNCESGDRARMLVRVAAPIDRQYADHPVADSSAAEVGRRQAAAAAAAAPLLSADVQPLHRAVLRQRRGVLRSPRRRAPARSRRRADRLERRSDRLLRNRARRSPTTVARELDRLAAAHARDGRAQYYAVRDEQFNPMRDRLRGGDGRIAYTPAARGDAHLPQSHRLQRAVPRERARRVQRAGRPLRAAEDRRSRQARRASPRRCRRRGVAAALRIVRVGARDRRAPATSSTSIRRTRR